MATILMDCRFDWPSLHSRVPTFGWTAKRTHKSERNKSLSETWKYLGCDHKCAFGNACALILQQNINRCYSAAIFWSFSRQNKQSDFSNWSKYNAKTSLNTKWRQISIECFHFFEQRFPRICLNKVPIVSVQHFVLSIPDYRHINFQRFPHFPIIIPIFHGESFAV